jgi:hypothetical protein
MNTWLYWIQAETALELFKWSSREAVGEAYWKWLVKHEVV